MTVTLVCKLTYLTSEEEAGWGTVGMAIPYAIFDNKGPVLPSAGDATSAPPYRYITIAATVYMVVFVPCSMYSVRGYWVGFFISDMKPKKATWPAIITAR